MLTELSLLPNQPTLKGNSYMCNGCLSNMLPLNFLPIKYTLIIYIAKGGVCRALTHFKSKYFFECTFTNYYIFELTAWLVNTFSWDIL